MWPPNTLKRSLYFCALGRWTVATEEYTFGNNGRFSSNRAQWQLTGGVVSDMKTFNVRELSRSTAEVLRACEHDGGAIIQYQDGRQFELVPRGKRGSGRRELPDFAGRQRGVFGSRKFSSAAQCAAQCAARSREGSTMKAYADTSFFTRFISQIPTCRGCRG